MPRGSAAGIGTTLGTAHVPALKYSRLQDVDPHVSDGPRRGNDGRATIGTRGAQESRAGVTPVAGLLDQAERSLTGASALWLGDYGSRTSKLHEPTDECPAARGLLRSLRLAVDVGRVARGTQLAQSKQPIRIAYWEPANYYCEITSHSDLGHGPAKLRIPLRITLLESLITIDSGDTDAVSCAFRRGDYHWLRLGCSSNGERGGILRELRRPPGQP